jgi:hypothetical protein
LKKSTAPAATGVVVHAQSAVASAWRALSELAAAAVACCIADAQFAVVRISIRGHLELTDRVRGAGDRTVGWVVLEHQAARLFVEVKPALAVAAANLALDVPLVLVANAEHDASGDHPNGAQRRDGAAER